MRENEYVNETKKQGGDFIEKGSAEFKNKKQVYLIN